MDDETRVETLTTLRHEHRILDEHIAALMRDPGADEVELRRLKKRKLQIKDAITRMQAAPPGRQLSPA